MVETIAITLAQWTGGVLIHQSILYTMMLISFPIFIVISLLFFYMWFFDKSLINIIEFTFFLFLSITAVGLVSTISLTQQNLKSECEIRSEVVYIENQEVPIDVRFCRVREELDGEFGEWYIREIFKNNG